MKNNWLLSALIWLLSPFLALHLGGWEAAVCAQNIDAEFEVIDLGDIGFEHPATAKFNLKNRGTEFFLKDVKPFCGCTEVKFPQKSIKKGENFVVEVTYDARLLGHFQKDVALMSEQFEQPFYLTVKGNVIVGQPEPELPGSAIAMGKLKVATNNVVFNDAHLGDVIQVKIPFTNTYSEPVSPIVTHVPSYMTAQITPNAVLPGKQGMITLELNANMLPNYGLTETKLYLANEPGEEVSKDREIAVSAVLLPTLMLSESQRLNAPKIAISPAELLLQGSALKGEVTIANVGKSPLHITTLQSTALGLTITLSATTINPGSTATLRVKGVKKQLKGIAKEPQIILISDDPACQKSIINVKTK